MQEKHTTHFYVTFSLDEFWGSARKLYRCQYNWLMNNVLLLFVAIILSFICQILIFLLTKDKQILKQDINEILSWRRSGMYKIYIKSGLHDALHIIVIIFFWCCCKSMQTQSCLGRDCWSIGIKLFRPNEEINTMYLLYIPGKMIKFLFSLFLFTFLFTCNKLNSICSLYQIPD